jgi:hypothetical protein
MLFRVGLDGSQILLRFGSERLSPTLCVLRLVRHK